MECMTFHKHRKEKGGNEMATRSLIAMEKETGRYFRHNGSVRG